VASERTERPNVEDRPAPDLGESNLDRGGRIDISV